MTEPIAYLNGDFLPASQLAVSTEDLGFAQGVAVSERLRTFRGQLFRLDEHLDRLANSLRIVGLQPGLSITQVGQVARRRRRDADRVDSRGEERVHVGERVRYPELLLLRLQIVRIWIVQAVQLQVRAVAQRRQVSVSRDGSTSHEADALHV